MQHEAKTLIIHCMDFRLHKSLHDFLEQFFPYDMLSIAGGVRDIVKGSKRSRFLIEQIKLSRDLHHIKTVVAINHRDCGAYGGSANFESPEAELEFQKMELLRAAEKIKSLLGVEVQAFFMDFTETDTTIENVKFITVE